MFQNRVHVDLKKADPLLQQICRTAFPGYSGTKLEVRVCADTDRHNVRSSWEGGSRDYFVFVHLGTLERSATVPAQSAFDRPIAGADSVPLPSQVVLVEHTIFCGKDLGLRIYVRQSDFNPSLLPPAEDFDQDEAVVLTATVSCKAHYGGLSRQQRSVLKADTWNAAKDRLVARGLLNKAGAITPAGRNAIEGKRVRDWEVRYDGVQR